MAVGREGHRVGVNLEVSENVVAAGAVVFTEEHAVVTAIKENASLEWKTAPELGELGAAELNPLLDKAGGHGLGDALSSKLLHEEAVGKAAEKEVEPSVHLALVLWAAGDHETRWCQSIDRDVRVVDGVRLLSGSQLL